MRNKDLTVAVLAGGNSSRFRSDKPLAKFRGETLVKHMVSIAEQLSNHMMVVVSTEQQGESLAGQIKQQIVVDPEGAEKCALNGAVTAFEYASTEYTMLLPVDTPLADVKLLKTLYELVEGHGAVVPSWPSGYIEPLHAVYLSEHAYSNGIRVLENGQHRMKDLLDSLTNVLYISTEVLQQMGHDLDTFININSPQDLVKLEKRFKIGG